MLSCDRRVCQPESWVKSHRVPGRQLQALVLAADSTTRPGTLQTRAHRKRRAPVPGVASWARTGGMSRASRRPASPPGGTWSRRMAEDCDPKGLHSKSPCDTMRRCTGRTYQRRLSCAAAGIIGIVGPDCVQSASVVVPIRLASRPRCRNLGAAECIQRTGWGSRDQGCRRNNYRTFRRPSPFRNLAQCDKLCTDHRGCTLRGD